ncbi:cation-translocating P-type ATPase [Paraburkholderia graminis]|uniref:Ca2+-transporting ATPase n=1 Tax=Paraburkholderia graminis TaxID=60548 RepID=A0ABD5CFF8_9BURK|nr:cation-translocating P-type ATPase [Paraburkholderia graminis]MDR6203965.1 Ca2+-transporting ATPase [Paraburkholderia graminis]
MLTPTLTINPEAGGPDKWHAMQLAAVALQLGTDSDHGLTPAEAAQRLVRHGANKIREQRRRTVLDMLISQFKNFMIVALLAAALVSGLIGEAADTLVIISIVLLNATVGLIQDYRAEHAMASLGQLARLQATVIRAGECQTIPASSIVPGDVVLLDTGSTVPADLRLVEASGLKVAEAVLTGESVPVEKGTDSLDGASLELADRTNMAFKGTVVTYGRARGIAVATGMATELGKIAGMLEVAPAVQTPLQKRLAAFGRRLATVVLVICAIIFATGVLRDEPVLLMLLTSLSLAVAAIPEALPAVVTVMLAVGARNMARKNALVRRLPAVETLGSVSWICTDKTGTLTLNEMRTTELYVYGVRFPIASVDTKRPAVRCLLEALALCNNVSRAAGGEVAGDPTEVALWRVAAEAGLDKGVLEVTGPRSLELPFDSDRKRMTTIHRTGSGFIAYTKGAPETVIERCSASLSDHGVVAMDHERVLAAAEAMANSGLRVLAVASRKWDSLPAAHNIEGIERGLTLLGLAGMRDPPRPDVRQAVEACRSAGITPVMITGDHPVTACAIARELGILAPDDTVLTGRELSRLTDVALVEQVAHTRVFARVDPAQKIRIVDAIRAHGQFVAMTGDGVNDAPALAGADIGIAMGKKGTDVARDAASIVLLDDNFATIVGAVEEGRRIFDNIRKFIRYALTCNSAEIWTIFLAPFLGLPIPLLPIHILWINLVTDGLPGLALAAEPAEKGVMLRPPQPPGESVFARGMWQHIVWGGLAMAGVTLLTQAYAIHVASTHWQTMTFTVLTLSQMGHVLAIRSEQASFFAWGARSNMPLAGAVLLTFALQLMTIYVPVLNTVFRTTRLNMAELAICLLLSSVVFALVEVEKHLIRRGFLYR